MCLDQCWANSTASCSFEKEGLVAAAQELKSLGAPVVCCAGSFEGFLTLACDAWPLGADEAPPADTTGAGDVYIAGLRT
eukprot:s1875_g5.t1